MHDPRPRPDLEAPPVRVIHQDQRNPIIGGEVPGTDILHVAAKVGVADGALIKHFEKAGGAAAELNIGPAVFTDGCLIEAIAPLDMGDFALAEGVASVGVVNRSFAARLP